MESDRNFQIPAMSPNSGKRIKFGIFGGRVGLPTNYSTRRWWIPINVRARMKNLNPENDLQKLKRLLWSN
jgi:hypothetical protein